MFRKSIALLLGSMLVLSFLLNGCSGKTGQPGGSANAPTSDLQKTGELVFDLHAEGTFRTEMRTPGRPDLSGTRESPLSFVISMQPFINIVWNGTSFSGQVGSLQGGLAKVSGTVSPDGSEIVNMTATHEWDFLESGNPQATNKGEQSIQLAHVPITYNSSIKIWSFTAAAPDLQKYVVSAASHQAIPTREDNLTSVKYDYPPSQAKSYYLSMQFRPVGFGR